jgi:hypothetical protein
MTSQKRLDYLTNYQKTHYAEHKIAMKKYYDTNLDKAKGIRRQFARRQLEKELKINLKILLADLVEEDEHHLDES